MAAVQQNRARGRILVDPHNLSLNVKPTNNKINKIKRKTTDGLATESEPSSFLTNGILVNGSDAIMTYQVNRCSLCKLFSIKWIYSVLPLS